MRIVVVVALLAVMAGCASPPLPGSYEWTQMYRAEASAREARFKENMARAERHRIVTKAIN